MAEQERWLQRGGAPGASRDEQTRMLEVVRRRGYAVALEVEERRLIGELLLRLRDDPRSEALGGDLRRLIAGLRRTEYQMTNARKTSYAVSTITAPVLNVGGDFQLAISVQGLPSRISRREVKRLGEGLLEACELASARVAREFERV
jgi:DNA-binding IclR family transcriptional regulator